MSEEGLTTFQRRATAFLIGCLGTRALVTWLAYSKPQIVPLLGIVAAIIALGFLGIYFGDLRRTGPEVFGDRIWWNTLRPIHAILYGLFAYYALTGLSRAWMFLALDVVLGATAWTIHHFV